MSEMSKNQQRRIRALLPKCANYDTATKTCLPLDGPCYMQHKLYTGAFCRYFSESVLPLDGELQAELSGNAGKLQTCTICSKPFVAVRPRLYCSQQCRQTGARARDRRRKRQQRQTGGNMSHFWAK